MAIPAFVNELAGTATEARAALEAVGAFVVRDVAPAALAEMIRAELASEPPPERIAVAGGDGTIGTAATVLVGCPTALAILPGGTLNHFARDHGIPLEEDAAARLAATGRHGTADVAYAGDRLFLNTSSVGAYVTFVRVRERMERYVGYRVASFLAAVRLFFHLRPVHVEVEVDGERRHYRTPLLFVGVGERELKSPVLGNRIHGGARCLHVIVVRERSAARLVALALEAVHRGIDAVAHSPQLDSFMVDACQVRVRGRQHRVAVDGEIVRMHTPLDYRLRRDALTIVVP